MSDLNFTAEEVAEAYAEAGRCLANCDERMYIPPEFGASIQKMIDDHNAKVMKKDITEGKKNAKGT